jgi:Zn-dependent protease with chaperone function
MDFFAAQDRARARTRWLVVYFVLGVTGLIVALYAVVMVAFGLVHAHAAAQSEHVSDNLVYSTATVDLTDWWRPDVLGWVGLGTLVIVGGACATKIAELRGGGSAVAESLGAQPVGRDTRDPAERRFLNIVEEMALAAGVPVPVVYVMEEDGINAFAAGFRPEDAAVTATRGALRNLSRDELQGVIGHEFSHILNGDMRLNIQLIGAVFGLVVITVIGRELVYMLRFSRGSRSDKGGNVLIALFFLGLALIVLGWLGVLFGRLIQSAVSRQREALADASAVQFTRNPEGLAGALKKIGGLEAGSRVRHAHVEETAHIFFAPAFNGIFATHPPLEQRIRALDPNWDGKFITPKEGGEDAGVPPVRAAAASPRRAESLVVALGAVAGAALAGVRNWRDTLPPLVREALASPSGCRALVLALTFDENPAQRQAQIAQLRENREPAADAAAQLADAVVATEPGRRLPLLELALAGLSGAAAAERATLLARMRELVWADHVVTLHEFALLRVAGCRLQPRPPVVGPASPQAYVRDVAAVLSALAYVGTDDDARAQAAFKRGAAALPDLTGMIAPLAREEATLDHLGVACGKLEGAPFPLKKQLLEAGAQVIADDGVIQPGEADMLRALAASLGCPLPAG